MSAYDVQITTKVSDSQYGIDVIGLWQLYLNSVLCLTTPTPLSYVSNYHNY